LIVAMRDTTPEFQRMVDAAYAGLTPAERVRICVEMFESARALVEASLPAGLAPDERRFRLCERFCGDLATRALRPRNNERRDD
jgi:hypothetical protein